MGTKFNKGKKRKTKVLHKNKKLQSVTLFSKLNVKSEHINTVNRTKNHKIIIFLCFRQYFDKKVGISCPQLSTKQLVGFVPTAVAPQVDLRFTIALLMPKLKL